MFARPSVIIMGGSLAGLTAALTLRDAGFHVEVYERSRNMLVGLGAGIVLHPATVRYFTLNNVLAIGDISVASHYVRYLGRKGDIAVEQPYSSRFSSFNALYRGLLDCFDSNHYHLDRAIVALEQDDTGVTVRFADGDDQRCDLLVCADGIRSSGRKLLLPGASLQYAGYIAWRGAISEAKLTAGTLAALRNAITYHLMPDSHFLTYPIPVLDRSPGQSQLPQLSQLPQPHMNWLWYRNVPQGPELDDLRTDREGVVREVSLNPGTVQQRHIERLREAASSLLPPPLVEVVNRTDQPFIQVVFDCAVDSMAFGRACLIGDAAFVARPHAAAGTAKAAEDAWKLSEALQVTGGNVGAALQRWEPDQLKLGRGVLARTREAGRRLQQGAWRVGEPLPFGLYETGDSIIPDP